jgi:hypothetical protein
MTNATQPPTHDGMKSAIDTTYEINVNVGKILPDQ